MVRNVRGLSSTCIRYPSLLLTWKPPFCRPTDMEAAVLLGQMDPPEAQQAAFGLVWGCGEGCPGSGCQQGCCCSSQLRSHRILRVPAGQGRGPRGISQCVTALIRREGSGQSRQQRATETHHEWRGQVSFLLEGECRCLLTMPLTPVINRGNPLPPIPLKPSANDSTSLLDSPCPTAEAQAVVSHLLPRVQYQLPALLSHLLPSLAPSAALRQLSS